jgi:hypothetical protein
MFATPKGKTPAGGAMKQTITLTLPQAVAFEPGNRWVDTKDWIVNENKNDFAPGSVMGMEDWLDKPAGKHGWLKMAGDNFKFADGTPIKFWGTNISYSDMAKADKPAEQWNAKWAKHGVNLVRLHKFIDHSWAGIMSEQDHFIPDPAKIKLFDQYHATAKARGIYLGWSASYGMKLTASDKNRVRFFDEVAAADPKGLRTYDAMLAAPVDCEELVTAEILWIACRAGVYCMAPLFVATLFADCRDPKDNKFLEVAVSGHAAVIVTGDRDLLDLADGFDDVRSRPLVEVTVSQRQEQMEWV